MQRKWKTPREDLSAVPHAEKEKRSLPSPPHHLSRPVRARAISLIPSYKIISWLPTRQSSLSLVYFQRRRGPTSELRHRLSFFLPGGRHARQGLITRHSHHTHVIGCRFASCDAYCSNCLTVRL